MEILAYLEIFGETHFEFFIKLVQKVESNLDHMKKSILQVNLEHHTRL